MSRQRQAGGAIGHSAWRPVDRPEPVLTCTEPRRTPHGGWILLGPEGIRIGPHNRCTHPTPPPPGRRFCAGDNACAFRLPAGVDLCPEHAREARLTLTQIRAESAAAMGFFTDELSRMEFGHPTGARTA